MSATELTRRQRRLLRQLKGSLERIDAGDAAFFARFPNRQHRVRFAGAAEIAEMEIVQGEALTPPAGARWFAVIKVLSPTERLKVFALNVEVAETDLSESVARAIWEIVTTPELQGVAL